VTRAPIFAVAFARIRRDLIDGGWPTVADRARFGAAHRRLPKCQPVSRSYRQPRDRSARNCRGAFLLLKNSRSASSERSRSPGFVPAVLAVLLEPRLHATAAAAISAAIPIDFLDSSLTPFAAAAMQRMRPHVHCVDICYDSYISSAPGLTTASSAKAALNSIDPRAAR